MSKKLDHFTVEKVTFHFIKLSSFLVLYAVCKIDHRSLFKRDVSLNQQGRGLMDDYLSKIEQVKNHLKIGNYKIT